MHERRTARGPRTELHNSGCVADLGLLYVESYFSARKNLLYFNGKLRKIH